MRNETKIQADGTPRTKGMRNPLVQAMNNTYKARPMRDRRDRRAKDARRSWAREDHG